MAFMLSHVRHIELKPNFLVSLRSCLLERLERCLGEVQSSVLQSSPIATPQRRGSSEAEASRQDLGLTDCFL